MKRLFADWKKIERLIKDSPHILLLTDYDGTLTPIVSKPKDAVLDKEVRRILRILSGKRRFHIGVISGRRVDDLKRRVALNKIYYAGDHGLQIKGPGISYLHPACRKFKNYLVRIKGELLLKTKPFKGAIVEYKAASISLHYRLVKRSAVKKLKAIFEEVCAPYIKKGKVKRSHGKKVWEIRLPVKWNKASAANKISKTLKLRKKKILPIYLGDDVTDEDVFFALRKKGLTVLVGRKKRTYAQYYVESPGEVRRFLVRLCQL
ncbi:MAG: trehalose-phosphatase [Candidatus Omnitrophica bacterium]|nr:trehalose-phosphatase [Candidatus Omnitrophota bacterium]